MRLLCGSVWESSEKWQWLLPGLWGFIQEEAVPHHLPWFQTLQFLPICHWCPSSYCPGAGAQREWIWVSPKSTADPLRGDGWESWSFFHYPNPHWFLQPEVIGIYFPGSRTLGWVVWCGAWMPHSPDIIPNFYPPHVGMGLCVLCLHISASWCS